VFYVEYDTVQRGRKAKKARRGTVGCKSCTGFKLKCTRCCNCFWRLDQWKRAQTRTLGIRSSTLAGCSHRAIPFLATRDQMNIFVHITHLGLSLLYSIFHAVSGKFVPFFLLFKIVFNV